MTITGIVQRTEAWHEARRQLVVSTDIPVILGLSPYKAEADLAADKAGAERETAPDPKRDQIMRLGLALEPVIRAEEELKHGIRLRRVNRLVTHPRIPWAATSLDFERVGERCVVEAKASRSRRWDEGVPQDVEAQVRWQMGVAGYPRAHVALLRSGSELECWDVEHDAATFDGLVDIAADFRARLAAGGPFAETVDSLKRRYPRDNGSEMQADQDIEAAVAALMAVRDRRSLLERDENEIEAAIKTRMGEVAVLAGTGWRITWKRTKDRTETDWRALADGLLRAMPEPERTALVGLHSATKPGFRPFRLVAEKGDKE